MISSKRLTPLVLATMAATGLAATPSAQVPYIPYGGPVEHVHVDWATKTVTRGLNPLTPGGSITTSVTCYSNSQTTALNVARAACNGSN